MPEYLGGITRDIIVNPITQTVETVDTGAYVGSLGSQAGLATCFGNSDGSISVFLRRRERCNGYYVCYAYACL